jgi:LIVCS family branched-chain amino acid:cation transporter
MSLKQENNSRAHLLSILQTGFAMFSMFFGSGNTIFPIQVGATTGTHMFAGTLGFTVTGVLVPFLGLLAMFLFNGDYFAFFKRLGNLPAWIIVTSIMAMIGPFAVIPRCILVSYATVHSFFPNINFYFFVAASCALIFFCTYKRRRIIEILGLYLTPILLLSLFVIIVCGTIFSNCETQATAFNSFESFKFGLLEGYNTMDIFAGFMFASVLLVSMKNSFPKESSDKKLLFLSIQSGVVGIGCLAAVYWGMSYVASLHASCLDGVSADKLLSALTINILGQYAGVLVCVAVCFACLTTAISLSLVFSEFMSERVTKGKVSYQIMLVITLLVSFFCSLLEFEGVQRLVIPILTVCYPVLILLAILNLSYKLIGFKPVKLPCFLAFVISLVCFLF